MIAHRTIKLFASEPRRPYVGAIHEDQECDPRHEPSCPKGEIDAGYRGHGLALRVLELSACERDRGVDPSSTRGVTLAADEIVGGHAEDARVISNSISLNASMRPRLDQTRMALGSACEAIQLASCERLAVIRSHLAEPSESRSDVLLRF